jgi:hypothetical protein
MAVPGASDPQQPDPPQGEGAKGTAAPSPFPAASAPPPPSPAAPAPAVDAAKLEQRKRTSTARVQAWRERHAAASAEQATKLEEKRKAEATRELTAKEEKELERELRGIVLAVWLIVQGIAALRRRPCADLTDEEAEQGARAWFPLARKHPGLVSVARFLAAPLWLIAMIKRKLGPKRGVASVTTLPVSSVSETRVTPSATRETRFETPGNALVTRETRETDPAAAALELELERKRAAA